ncbi:hypothetical protein D9B18_22580 [Salmonella enterica]|nr:hypothetical protein [Salmonella enterica]
MKERGITDGLTMNQLAERNAEHVATIAALEPRYTALAAENAALNKFIAASCFVQDGEELAWYPAIDHAPETPATDAFLAEVRAHGVEMFSEKFGGGTLISDMVKEIAKDFAAQLRKGGAA